MIITYQDFEKSQDKKAFVLSCINNFKGSDFYNDAIDSRNYYRGENTTIFNRRKTFIGANKTLVEDITKANNKVANEIYSKVVKQCNSYLFSNGITLEDNIKKELGKRIDVKLQRAGINAQVDGVAWGYCFINEKGKFNIDMWSGIEFIPLFDEETNILRAGIRFWQIDINKPMYVELYEKDGITKFSTVKNEMQEIKSKTAYKIIRSKDALEETIIGEENWSILPIVPLYFNDIKTNALTKALKNKLDLYDIISSDFGNNLEDTQDVYWVIKNYMGQDLNTFIEDYKYYKSIKVSGEGDASPHTIEVPWQARDKALEILRKNIYEDSMALDTSILSGGSLTNVAIKTMMINLDLKTDEFENNAIDFIEGIIELWQEYSGNSSNYNIKFIRRSIVNDTEVIGNIMLFREDISRRKALELNPYIDDDEIDKILSEVDEESMQMIKMESPQENNPLVDKDINLKEGK